MDVDELHTGGRERTTTTSALTLAAVVAILAGCYGLAFATGGCDSSSSASGACPPPPDIAVIDLACVPVQAPVVATTGPCTAAVGQPGESAQQIVLTSIGAGTCHVAWAFGSGATSSVDVDFVAQWRALGSDPHGCGQEFIAVTADGSPCIAFGCQVSFPEPMCDAGRDAVPSE